MKNKVIFLLEYMFNFPFYVLSLAVKKNNNIWIFGSWSGEKYSDNSKYLFEYVNENHKEIKAIWVTSSWSVIKELRNKNLECYYKYSFKAIYYAVFAKVSVFVQTNYLNCLMFMNNKNTLLIQLWHGAPIKKIGNDNKLHSNKDKMSFFKKITFQILNNIFPYIANERYSLFIACSLNDQQIYQSAFHVENVKITGFPRNDILFNNNSNKEKLQYKKIIYLPTFRGEVGSQIDLFFKYDFNTNKWIEFLENNNIILYVKMHPFNLPKEETRNILTKSKNIIFLENEDVSEFLSSADILITDYSSVYLDYLLTGKPLIFTPFDFEEYLRNDREFYYNYEKITPGPKCMNWNDVLGWVDKYNNSELFSVDRKLLQGSFHKYTDSGSSERVYSEIVRLANNT
ncbi:hypothetical protein HOL24_06320 [bacterium]|jgi:CDP-glycerol glycerophosphotransferase|nr:hypothetical protein [bacterium]